MSSHKSAYRMLPIPEALDLVMKNTHVLEQSILPLADAGGRVLAQEVKAKEPLPPFPASMKDGYAVVAQDGTGEYPVIGEVTAGIIPTLKLVPKTVMRITTGSAVPDGANAIVMVEDTVLIDRKPDGTGKVKILKAVPVGRDIRPIGSDIKAGDTVLTAGDVLGPAEIGLLATVGHTSVLVRNSPKVAVLSTGDELVESSETPGPGKIRDSNRPMLLSLLRSINIGIECIDLGIAGDTQKDLEEKVNKGLETADVLITSGGVSMGDLDLMKPLLEKSGTVHFGRVLMKPGKPLTFATLEWSGKKKLVFALPGNPVSSYVTFCLVALPCLRKLAGFEDPYLPQVAAKITKSIKLDQKRPEYHRVNLSWDAGQNCFIARSTGDQASSRLLSMRTANGLALLGKGSGFVEAGTMVPTYIIGPL